MKMTVTNYDFRSAFLDIRPNNFSLMGLDCLFDYLADEGAFVGGEWMDESGKYLIVYRQF